MISVTKASLPVVGLLAVLALSGCSLLSPSATPETPAPSVSVPAAPAVTAAELSDTTWSGTDSLGTRTTFTFHENGSTAVTFGDKPYDDAGDTWAIDAGVLIVSIKNVGGVGDVTYSGDLTSASDPVVLDVVFTLDTATRSLKITKQ